MVMDKKAVGKYIVADPKVCHGKLTFKGTRILVADVLDLVAQGADWETIIRQCHGSITTLAITEAIRLAGNAFVDHADANAVFDWPTSDRRHGLRTP
jgi:uncharacterized protein (DUF433 family)